MFWKTKLAVAACSLLLVAQSLQAHFVWIDLKPSPAGQSQIEIYFSELPEPGDPQLINKVAHAKAWLRSTTGQTQAITFAPAGRGQASLSADCPSTGALSLEATCDYGVYSRGPMGVLLHYYAKRLVGDWSGQAGQLARAERLQLDVVPECAGNSLNLEVLYQGKPSAGAQIVVLDAAGNDQTLTTDDHGHVSIDTAGGRYAIRAAHIEPDRGGMHGGKSYSQTWHYATLVLDVPPADAPRAMTARGVDVPATVLLKRAREGRSMWKDFPGCTMDLAVTGGAQQVAGKATIDADGSVSLQMPEAPLRDWVEEQLNSLVQHRMPDGEVTQGNVTYADGDLDHPLGRKIDLGDPNLQSAYRIKDDVIMEVNRSMGPLRFTISVLEIVRNQEHKYLPRSFTMNFFDAKTGELKTSLAYWNRWQRVGSFDLPKTIVEISAKKDGATTRQIEFKNCQLLEAK